MKGADGLILLAASLSGCADEHAGHPEKQARLECAVAEREPPERTFKIAAELRDQNSEGVWEFRGTTSYFEAGTKVERPIHGYYLDRVATRKIEMLGFSDNPTGETKLNFAVQPDHPVLRRRGTDAVVLTGNQTVENGTLADVACRTVEPS